MTSAIDGIQLTARNVDLPTLGGILERQQARKFDAVVPASRVSAIHGNLHVSGARTTLSLDGVTTSDQIFRPSDICDGGISEKLGIPRQYLRKMREQAVDLYDANVNGWLLRAEDKKYLLRGFTSDDDGEIGIGRALLSDGYRIIDNLDGLTALLRGLRDSGMKVTVSCDLSERRMIVRVHSEEIRSLAPALLSNYRSPFTGKTGADNPVVFAGFVFTNGETGGGAHTFTPQIKIQVCNNGMTLTRDALRAVHLGARMDEGIIRWGEDTKKANLDLVSKQARDAVRTFLDVKFVEKKIIEIEEKAGRKVSKPKETIEFVTSTLRFTEAEREAIFEHFIIGGDLTAGGVMHAVTSVAQTLPDPDAAYDMESVGIRAMELAATA
ncbi:DUF932 domain-containing protein [Paractinoplanes hotanensis]|uniref:DUF932 domain-containing protein n=1 Tax=Paractinoplanes hotanensis TaxID=2906497 RepID=A0ABT0Y850_9ACTN|nr:DUF932 domain-containing protein [Actinoplanes hotanensis]MCM4082211.1 DUF932 domain-containing protein [Actinoplanes hotanensis]